MEQTSAPSVELTIGGIIKNGINIGLKNALSLIGATILWILTIWIPYINVGTTIGLTASVIAMSKGGIISPTEIFDAKYRRYMGEFFILMGIQQMAIFIGIIFLIIPGIVISIAWGQSIYLLIDKKLNPIEALKSSNDITYGHKWTIFLGTFLLVLAYYLVTFLVSFILSKIHPMLGGVSALVLLLLFIPIVFGASAHIYATLSKKLG